jgi:hypothetical protein
MPNRVYVQEIGVKTLDHDPAILLEACAKRKQSRFLAGPTVLLMSLKKIAAAPPAGGAAAKAIKIARS